LDRSKFKIASVAEWIRDYHPSIAHAPGDEYLRTCKQIGAVGHNSGSVHKELPHIGQKSNVGGFRVKNSAIGLKSSR